MNNNLYEPNCIRTFSGIYMNVFEPTVDMINIEDIAHALSNTCRFGGHTPKYYSVAQHCVFCAENTKGDKLEALLHDAGEAYLTDMPKPIKQKLRNFKKLEDNLMFVIAKKFGFNYPLSRETKIVDELALKDEWEFVIGNKVLPMYTTQYSKFLFLEKFNEIKDGKTIF